MGRRAAGETCFQTYTSVRALCRFAVYVCVHLCGSVRERPGGQDNISDVRALSRHTFDSHLDFFRFSSVVPRKVMRNECATRKKRRVLWAVILRHVARAALCSVLGINVI